MSNTDLNLSSAFTRLTLNTSTAPTNNNVTGSQSAELLSNAPPKTRGTTIVVLTGVGDDPVASTLKHYCGLTGVSFVHEQVRPVDLAKKIQQLRGACVIGDNTQLVIIMHGNHEREHSLGSARKGSETYALVEALRKPFGNFQACSANVYLAACYVGRSDLSEKLEKLHHEYAGACFLLTGAKLADAKSIQAALLAMLAEFDSVEDGKAEPPSSHLIFGRMASHRSDHITMIEGNAKAIAHIPKNASEIGEKGFFRGLDEFISDGKRAYGGLGGVIEEKVAEEEGKSPEPANADGERKDLEKGRTRFKPTIIGDAGMLTATLEALKQHGLKGKNMLPDQRERILWKLSNNSKLERLRSFLEGNENLCAEASKGELNLANSLIIESIASL